MTERVVRRSTERPEEMIAVELSPYAETPLYYRTTRKVQGAKRWFEKSAVSVVERDAERIVLSMPKSYAEKREGISDLLVNPSADDHGARRRAPSERNDLIASELRSTERVDIQLGAGGRILIPAVLRDAMQVKEGDRLMARVVDGELRVKTPRVAVKLAQKMVRKMIPDDGTSLVETLFDERRREVEDELRDG